MCEETSSTANQHRVTRVITYPLQFLCSFDLHYGQSSNTRASISKWQEISMDK